MDYTNRKSPRLQNYDYTNSGYYFITVCTHNKKCLFGEPNHLNKNGRIVYEHIERLSAHFDTVIVDKFIVMPNHIHMIVVIGCDPTKTNSVKLDTVVGLLKSGISRNIHATEPTIQIWQRSFHDHVIRNKQAYEQIWQYIDTNPQKWSEDCFYVCDSDQS